MTETSGSAARQGSPRFSRRGWPLAVIAALGLVFLALVPVLSPSDVSFMFYLMFWAVMGSAFNIIYGLTGYLPFGYVAFYGAGGYVMAIGTQRLGLPPEVSVLAGGVVGTAMSVLFAPTLRLKGIYFAIVNLALAMALQVIIANLPEAWTGGSLGLSLAAVYNPTYTYYGMVLLLAVTLLAAQRVAFSRLGIALRCIREDPDGAEVLGVDVARARLKAWMLAALLPSLAGALDTWFTAIVDPETAFSYLITVKTVVYSMFGGLGTLTGPVLGAIGLHSLDNLIWGSFPRLNLLILGVLVIVLVLFFPRGLVGTLVRRFPVLRMYVR